MGGQAGTGARKSPWPVSNVVCALGEGPTWDADKGVVRWVDIDRGVLYEADVRGGADAIGHTRKVLTVDGTLGAAVHAERGGFLLATARHLEHRDPTGITVAAWELIPAGQKRRLNDGKCDPDGRYVVGSLSLSGDGAGNDHGGDEQLWRLEHDGTVSVLEEGLSLSNGLGWSPDGRVMYHVDTLRHSVSSRPYDPVSGDAGLASILIDTGQGFPDGLAVDGAGDLWIAMWGDGEIRRFAPDGTLREVLPTGVVHTTSCAFVGPGLDLMVVTSAFTAPIEETPPPGSGHEETATPNAIALDGRLLAVHPPFVGLPTRAWRPCVNPSTQ